MNAHDILKIKEFVLQEQDQFRRGLLLIGYLGNFLLEQNMPLPHLVGGAVVEFFTRGSYKTSDFDIVHGDKKLIERYLQELGFEVIGTRSVYSEEMNVHLDILQEPVVIGKFHPEKYIRIQLSDEFGNPLYVEALTLEDIVLDRLNAAAWWGGNNPSKSEDFLWAVTMLAIGGDTVDTEYLNRKTEEEKEPDMNVLLHKALRKSKQLREKANDHGDPKSCYFR
jgi:hypothetical protein